MRRLLSPVREATRNRAEILGCNYPFFTGTDLADAVRTGGDIHAGWGEISANSINIAARYWMNRTLFQCDPDFALCRSPETADDPEMFDLRPVLVYSMPDDREPGDRNRALVGRDIGRSQIEVLLSLILVSAGSINLSDRMTRLNEEGLELARKVVSAEPGETAVPLDLFEQEHARFWLQKIPGGHRLLLVNWENEPQELAFDLKRHGLPPGDAVDFWRGRRIGCRGGRVEALLPPRSCLLLEFR
ncbi:hypothetical protein SDC9_156900 [bioreactor metagenome]|uniref:Alpha galactosidase C-terminal beta sandwich domain-containing protein n=1 Tax=bioreactor metagenome TaxID=1076179 RepID=A0A645F8F2_9ZZZZ